MGDIERYIIEFLCYGDTKVAQRVRLSSDVDWTLRYPQLDQVPAMERVGDEVIVSPDLIYNTFFFISRAEELLNDKRDKHGRFMASYSILGEKNRLQTPLIDEYSRMLMELLEIPLPAPGFSAIHLTHDVDTIEYYRHLRGTVGGLLRGQVKAVKASWQDLHNDPAYTFPWLQELERPYSVIYFIKDTSGCGLDYPQYNLHGKDFHSFLNDTKGSNVQYGWHSSAQSRCLSAAHRSDVIDYTLHRSHYLNCSIERMQQLVEMGVKDDYTMAFADCAGWRLQTTRPVRWIHPLTKQLTSLTLHPLTAMDVTLSNYMQLTEEEAVAYMQQLLAIVQRYHGEVNLLWHNSNINALTYHKNLYPRVLQML